jgi:apolipoprotein N-acyltransferase
MKIAEKFLGVSSIVIMLIGFFVRFPYMAITITLTVLLLSMTYFVFSFALFNNVRLRHIFKSGSFKGVSTLRIIGSILVGFVFSIMCIGILFKFQLWPNSDFTLLVGLMCLGILVIISLVRFLSSKDTFYKNLLIRTLIIGIIGFCFYSLSYENILEIKYRDDPEYVEAEKKSMQNPKSIELGKKALEERQKMSED